MRIQMGSDLYAANCADCHGTLAESAKISATEGRILQGMLYEPMLSRFNQNNPLSPEQVELIAEALQVIDYTTTPAEYAPKVTYVDFNGALDDATINAWANVHQQGLAAADQPFYRYFCLPDPIYQNPEHRNIARVCGSRAINSVALGNPDIINPINVSNGAGACFAIDLREYFDPAVALERWGRIAGNPNRLIMPVEEFAHQIHNEFVYSDLVEQPPGDRRVDGLFGELGIMGQEPSVRMAMEQAITFGARYAEGYTYEEVDKMGNSVGLRTYWRSGDPVYGKEFIFPDDSALFRGQCFARRDEADPRPVLDTIGARILTWDDPPGSVPNLRFDGLPSGQVTHPDACVGGTATASEA